MSKVAKGSGVVVELGGSAVGLGLQYKSIQRRAEGQNAAVHTSTDKFTQNQENAAAGLSRNQDAYVTQLTEIHQMFAQDQIAAIRAGAVQAAGGATRGTTITLGGINRGAAIEMRANKAMMEGQSRQPARCVTQRFKQRDCTWRRQ